MNIKDKEGIYVCSRVRHAQVWKDFRTRSAPISSSWIDEAGDGETADFKELWARIREEVRHSRALVFYCKDMDDFPFKGALVEVGMALAFGKPVFAYLGANVKLEGRTFRPLGSWIEDRRIQRCGSLDAAMRLALYAPLPSSPTPSAAAVTAARLHANAPSGSLPTYSEIRTMAAELIRLNERHS